jgi:hypothetical protein
MTETTIQKQIMLAASQAGAKVFRNNVANAVVGQMQRIEKDGPVMLRKGDWIVRNGRRTQFGLCVGSSDLIGWRSVKITEDMVGKTFALFLAMEVKAEKGKATEDQFRFIKAVRYAGGLSGIVRSPDDAISVCNPLL